ncbi:MAG: DEAD/DEAH box helicase family protein [Thaumarchaeota archaeon]|nr:DEAD/DEAH box helicase family protein [Nitrososphaerota archaeon]
MELKFDSTQEFQIDAVDAVVRLFDGQSKIQADIRFVEGAGFIGAPNRLDLTEIDLLGNLQETQRISGVSISKEILSIVEAIETAGGKKEVKFSNFSVEMETGTGKTYVYIRTALELNKRYGFQRFIIVVPSIAIKEGVLKTFQVTEKHFSDLYDRVPYRFYAYDSSNLTQVRQFCSSSNLEFMIMTLDSFNKSMTEEGKGNVIRRPTDRLQGAVPIHLIQETRPILILDEPQNMESERSISALAALNPLLALRYSATHRTPYNLIYRLTPADAYKQGLVKKIEVASVVREDDLNQVFISLEAVTAKKNTVSAMLIANKLFRSQSVKPTKFSVMRDDNLGEKTNLPEYKSFTVEEINPGSNTILFTNGIEVSVGESHGADKESTFEAQIRYTVEEHFRKQRRLKDLGIKVLSLFFIDRVDNYATSSGIIRRLFLKAFNELKQGNTDWGELDAEEVQAAYFAATRKKEEVILEDSSGKSQKDEEAYDLIMKDKEKLLSFESKVAFIFSHSALREGWDNPNVFQICTLNQSVSEVKKRQEIGRGVRLAVNQEGERIRDSQVNLLTVVANQSYESFVEQYQQEVVEEFGVGVEHPPPPANARKPRPVKLRKEMTLKPEFKELWERIRQKTHYSVKVDTERLIDDCVKLIDSVEIRAPRVTVIKARVDLNKEGAFEALQISSARTLVDLAGRYPLPNLTDMISHILENTSPPVRLSKRTLVEIFLRTKKKHEAMDNPFEFASLAARHIRDRLTDYLVDGIKYERVNEWYEMSLFKEEMTSWEQYVVSCERSIYDGTEFDSDVERRFIEDLERLPQVFMYFKLPPWFTITTPVGTYNPDWAIVWDEGEGLLKDSKKLKLYLVRETKGTTILNDLRPDERRKIICAQRHFGDALGVDYKVITNAKQLP